MYLNYAVHVTILFKISILCYSKLELKASTQCTMLLLSKQWPGYSYDISYFSIFSANSFAMSIICIDGTEAFNKSKSFLILVENFFEVPGLVLCFLEMYQNPNQLHAIV